MTRCASAASWKYQRTDVADIVEFASWRGAGTLGLRAHFHDEAQLVLVLSGSRDFRINGATVTVAAGHAALIPAGMLHAPVATSDAGTACLNAYIPASHGPSSVRIARIHPRWQSVEEISPERILEIADDMLSGEISQPVKVSNTGKLGAVLSESDERICDIAANLGRSREGFTRMVTRELGIAPHAYRVLARLNLARQLLRQGSPIAVAAAEAGFSDQSHLTRLFRRTFGTTPGVYRRD
jgi:AraC-like DNA-binding protein